MGKQLFTKIVSFVFHPFWIPGLATLIILWSGHYLMFMEPRLLKSMLIVVMTVSMVFPLLIVPLFYFSGSLPDFKFKKKKHRLILLSIVFVVYFAGILLMRNYGFPPFIIKMFAVYTTGVFLVMIAQIFLKLSIYTASWGSLIGLCLYLNLHFGVDLRFFLMILFVICGMVATSRMIDFPHKPKEIYYSFLLGALTMTTGMFMLT